MVVEDNEASRDALSRRLELQRLSHRAGGRRRTKRSQGPLGVAGISILMDLGLPGIDGCEAEAAEGDRLDCADPHHRLSAHAMTSDRDMALAAGGDDFETKPVRFRQLLEKISALIRKT